jgi:hypothetical protein
MALKHLTTAEMIALSTQWVTGSSAERSKLEQLPELVPILRRIEMAHERLLYGQGPSSEAQVSALQDLRGQAEEVDAQHDRIVRGMFFVLSGFAHLAQEQEQVQELLALRDKLLPNRLSTVQLSYAEEASAAEEVERCLTEKDWAFLRQLSTPYGDLARMVELWLDLGRGLCVLEKKRLELEKKHQQEHHDESLLQARNDWIRATSLLLSTLEMSGSEVPGLGKILVSVRESERKASFRAMGTNEVSKQDD